MNDEQLQKMAREMERYLFNLERPEQVKQVTDYFIAQLREAVALGLDEAGNILADKQIGISLNREIIIYAVNVQNELRARVKQLRETK